MLRRLQKLVKGPKKSHSKDFTPEPYTSSQNRTEVKQSNDKKTSNKKVNNRLRNGNSPSHVDQRISRNFDEFKRNDTVAFDIIPTSSVNVTNNGNSGGVRPRVTSENSEPEDSTKVEEIEETLPKTEHLTEPDRIVDNGTSNKQELINMKNIDGDLTNSKTQKENHGEKALSMDEKETLDMLDGILDNALEFDVADTEGDELDAVDVIVTNSNEHIQKIDDITIEYVERKEEEPIDYDEVLADSKDSCETSSADSKNWQLSYGDPNRQSHWKLIPKSSIYLPSTEEKSPQCKITSSFAPELPPADYSDFESEDEDSADEQVSSVVPEPIMTSFSSVQHNGDVEDTVTLESLKPLTQSPVITGFSSKDLPSNNNCNNNSSGSSSLSDTVSSSLSNYAKTTISSSSSRSSKLSDDVIILNSVSPPRSMKPRITSFRKNIEPLSLSAKPVNDLVKKFETLSVQAVQF